MNHRLTCNHCSVYAQPTWTEEMSEGLFVEDDKDEDEAESDTSEVINVFAPVNVMERKTKKERRKEKRKRALASSLFIIVVEN